MSEEWRPVPGYEGLYSVSDLGRVRRDTGGRGTYAGRILKPVRHPKGYLQINLHRGGKGRLVLVHRLVMAAFVGPCPEGMGVLHLDGDCANNALLNLEYGAHRESILSGYKRGGRVTGQKLTLAQVAEVRQRLAAGESGASIARAFGVRNETIYAIKHGHSWRHRLDQELAA